MIVKTTLGPAEPAPALPRKAAAVPAERFQQALRRLAHGDDEAGAEARPADDPRAAVPLQVAGVAPLPPAVPAPAAAAAGRTESPMPEPVAVVALRRAAASAPAAASGPEAVPSRWQLELSATGMAPQQLEVQRSAAGTLQLVVGGAEPPPLQQQERLRQRLATRGHALRFRPESER